MDIDVWEVIDAAKTKPFGFMPFYPGPGLGGHCIPIDPFYLSWKARQSGFECRFIELAGHVNSSMPDYVVERVAEALNTVQKADQRLADSPVRRGVQEGRQRHARVAGARHPRAAVAARRAGELLPIRACPSCSTAAHALRSHGLVGRARSRQPDCAVICTDHTAFDYDALVKSGTLIVDTRNALRGVEGGDHLPALTPASVFVEFLDLTDLHADLSKIAAALDVDRGLPGPLDLQIDALESLELAARRQLQVQDRPVVPTSVRPR